MPWNGSGTFARQYGSSGWTNDKNAGTKIVASRHDTNDDDLATGINNAIAKDGQNTAAADLPMGGFKHTGVGNAIARNQYAAAGQVQDSSLTYATIGGGSTGDAIVLSMSYLAAYATGLVVRFVASASNTTNVVVNINSIGSKAITKNGTTPLIAGDIPSGAVITIVYDGTQFQLVNAASATVTSSDCFGRLTLTSGTAVTTSDVTAATTLYFTPYKGNTVSIYDGSSAWQKVNFSEVSIAVPASTSQVYDVFGYLSSGSLALELTAWTNDTTRATTLVLQNGVLVKSGTTTRRYLGSFRTTTVAGQTEDSAAKRYVWNMYNRVQRKMLVQEATASWNYNSSVIRQARATATNQLDFVIGWSEDCVFSTVDCDAFNTAGGASTVAFVGIGLDSTTTLATDASITRSNLSTANSSVTLTSKYTGYPGVGRHTLVWLEATNATANNTFEGTVAGSTKSGISGLLMA